MNVQAIHSILKEEIPHLEFENNEVLINPNDIEHRKQMLLQGMILGNTYHTKVKMIFESMDEIHQVETTIWATTEEFVLLKGGVYLPIKCIHKVIIV